MPTVNIFDAKTTLSKLIESIESGKEEEIVIARHGRPVARLTGLRHQRVEKRLGVAKGRIEIPDAIDGDNDTIRLLFAGSGA